MTNLARTLDHWQHDFPILQQQIQGKPLVYLDTAASSQKPNCVIEAISHYYQHDHANVHRGIHSLSLRATTRYEQAREKIRGALNAHSVEEIIFVRGATEAINLVAQSYGRNFLQKGDEIIVSVMEHHANIVPWQLLSEQIGTVLRVIPISDAGELDQAAYQALFNKRSKMVALTHVSNVLGTINPVKEMITFAHQQQVPVLIDGAQAFAHLPVDVQALDCDFYALSSHKAYGPTGIGVLYGKKHLLEKMPPYQGGGDMIAQVSFQGTRYNQLPYKFEAGTPAIAAAIGFGVAIDYLHDLGFPALIAHEKQLLNYALEQLRAIPGLQLLGDSAQRIGVVSWILDGVHPHDLGTFLDHQGIAIRAGHHCAMPLMERMGVAATARMSLGIHNTHEDIDALIKGILMAKGFFT